MDHKITDNFLPIETANQICLFLLEGNFPWYYNSTVTGNVDENNNEYFTHLFYANNGFCSDFIQLVQPIIDLINPRSLWRIKANLYPCSNEIKEHGFHVDTKWNDVKTAVYYVNDNNGYTALANGTKIESVKNRIVKLEPLVSHTSSTSTTSARLTINFNWF